jgi:hypothetical protein
VIVEPPLFVGSAQNKFILVGDIALAVRLVGGLGVVAVCIGGGVDDGGGDELGVDAAHDGAEADELDVGVAVASFDRPLEPRGYTAETTNV